MKKVVAVSVRKQDIFDDMEEEVFLVVELEEEDIEALKKSWIDVREMQTEETEDPVGNKGFVFLAPVVAALPSTATVIGAATLGVVGGAAAVVGNRIGSWFMPKAPTKVEVVK